MKRFKGRYGDWELQKQMQEQVLVTLDRYLEYCFGGIDFVAMDGGKSGEQFVVFYQRLCYFLEIKSRSEVLELYEKIEIIE